MKTTRNIAWLFPLGLALASPPMAFAQLPTLDKQPWLGYFAAYEGRHFKVGITGHGDFARELGSAVDVQGRRRIRLAVAALFQITGEVGDPRRRPVARDLGAARVIIGVYEDDAHDDPFPAAAAARTGGVNPS